MSEMLNNKNDPSMTADVGQSNTYQVNETKKPTEKETNDAMKKLKELRQQISDAVHGMDLKNEQEAGDKDDPVNHPSHYTDGKIEVADYISDKNFNFFLGNVVKYVSRAGKKDPEKRIEDLRKAQWYLNYEIAKLEKEKLHQALIGVTCPNCPSAYQRPGDIPRCDVNDKPIDIDDYDEDERPSWCPYKP